MFFWAMAINRPSIQLVLKTPDEIAASGGIRRRNRYTGNTAEVMRAAPSGCISLSGGDWIFLFLYQAHEKRKYTAPGSRICHQSFEK